MRKTFFIPIIDNLDTNTDTHPSQLSDIFVMAVSDELDIDTDAQNFQQDWATAQTGDLSISTLSRTSWILILMLSTFSKTGPLPKLETYPSQLSDMFVMTVSDELDIDTDAQHIQRYWDAAQTKDLTILTLRCVLMTVSDEQSRILILIHSTFNKTGPLRPYPV
ncbi:hypothetical protein J6590_092957 [Homalodisca vitripennis]|nr:hypothetical protein J6590_092957 [Homalodisca vitripennis]